METVTREPDRQRLGRMTLADQLAALEPLPPATVARLAGLNGQSLRAKRIRGGAFTRQQLAHLVLQLRRLADAAEEMVS